MSTFRQVWVVCDECGSRSLASDEDSLKARLAAMADGWKHVGLGCDYCPEHIPASKRPPVAVDEDALW